MVKTEDDPLDAAPPAGTEGTFAAMAYLDQAVTDAGGIALRYGGFYGNANDRLLKPVRKRLLPIIGNGEGFMSFVHLDDAGWHDPIPALLAADAVVRTDVYEQRTPCPATLRGGSRCSATPPTPWPPISAKAAARQSRTRSRWPPRSPPGLACRAR